MDDVADIAQLDAELDAFDDELRAELVAVNAGLLAQAMSLVDRLDLHGRATTSDEVKRNMRAVTMWRADLPDVLDRMGLGDAINKVVAKMAGAAGRINVYYTRIDADFTGKGYANIVASLTEQTRRVMAETALNTYGPVLDEVLNWNVLTKATGAELRTALLARLPESGVAVRHVSQVSSDALYTFSRGYSQSVAEGLNLKHYYYMGSETALTRGFCHERIGRAYTQKEVEAWAELSWVGRIPGTTKQSIFWYCGGYNCRHRMLPISKNTYSIFTTKNQ